jgi:hypothetical protein
MSNLFDEEALRPANVQDDKCNASSSTGDIAATKLEANTELNANADADAELLVDGGRMGWTCVLGSWFALFSTFGLLNT